MSKLLKLNWVNPKVVMTKDEIRGRNQVAIDEISINEVIAIFGGHVLTLKEMQSLPDEI